MEYEGYSGAKIKQADVVLLGYPLMMNMSRAVRKADVEYYSPRTDPGGPAMTWGMHAVRKTQTTFCHAIYVSKASFYQDRHARDKHRKS